MKPIRIDDLPAHLQAEARRQMAPTQPCPAVPALPQPRAKRKRTRKQPTQTELAYRTRYLQGKAASFNALTFHLANGHSYTPDWTYWHRGRLYCVEVKGSYKLGSYQRARFAFDQAALEWPCIVWVWAELTDGAWKVRTENKEGQE